MGIVDAAVEGLAKRDRAVVLGGLAALLALSWTYTVVMEFGLAPTEAHGVSRIGTSQYWTGLEAIFMFLMWVVMMVAMMTPGGGPDAICVRAAGSHAQSGEVVGFRDSLSCSGISRFGRRSASLPRPCNGVCTPLRSFPRSWTAQTPCLSGTLLLAAGVYQFTPLKHACLAKCLAPMGFLMTEWRDGIRGKFVMGARHGAYCIGCCWLLMALLFVGGVMSLLWITGLAVTVLAEKVLPGGRVLSAVLGVIAIGLGDVAANKRLTPNPSSQRTRWSAPLNFDVRQRNALA